MEINKIYNEECIEGMKRITDGSVDAVVCDLPYGTMKGINEKFEWDECIPTQPLFDSYERVLRRGGVAVLFSQEPYTSHLRSFSLHNMLFCYPLIWKKNSPGNAMMAQKAPVSFFEDISVFVKYADSALVYPLRDYAKRVMEYTGMSGARMEKILAKKGVEKPYEIHHFIAGDGYSQIRMIDETAYNSIIEHFHIDKMDGFKTYDELKQINAQYKQKYGRVFNLPDGKKSMSNILEFKKDNGGFHPTQKPVSLIQTIVETYTNPGDLVLDNCMGSGTTAIACIRSKRNYVGFELNKEYFEKANARIENENSIQRLF